jgi:hypothetical protein
MRIKHSQLAHFEKSYRWFHTTMDPEGIRKAAALELNNLESSDKAERVHAVKLLGFLCFLELNMPGEVSKRLLRLFEHYAQFSQFEDVRFGCIDAIYLSRDLSRLKSLCLTEIGCIPTDHYRRQLASRLHSEIYPSMEC